MNPAVGQSFLSETPAKANCRLRVTSAPLTALQLAKRCRTELQNVGLFQRVSLSFISFDVSAPVAWFVISATSSLFIAGVADNALNSSG